jgi:hypothetical protein
VGGQTSLATDLHEPPLWASMPRSESIAAAFPERIPLAQHVTTATPLSLSAGASDRIESRGMFTEPSQCPPENSIGVLTSTTIAPPERSSLVPGPRFGMSLLRNLRKAPPQS